MVIPCLITLDGDMRAMYLCLSLCGYQWCLCTLGASVECNHLSPVLPDGATPPVPPQLVRNSPGTTIQAGLLSERELTMSQQITPDVQAWLIQDPAVSMESQPLNMSRVGWTGLAGCSQTCEQTQNESKYPNVSTSQIRDNNAINPQF